ncbi:prolyl oligopeptidase family serine peptidase [Tanticharoenia sakaeratensis]|uniref:Prolyl-oligopeptidase n=1 Tax=Tanticharoenia sakaeratensis NBRC 103193 TaxID=1231623 RepID=A0A0D6MN28_9PROT|nr:prolyl oligopeptidase family serine peptidase [Tanticharoenia sakaeratensis]GAN55097.1 prolyl-oligopeptidase [Tanticharoenia sakaeratensis NBRC 103193]GBQ20207.1 prolyl oligopeptidase [Tanticharoenia sakaeratensis NBRC 103193]
MRLSAVLVMSGVMSSWLGSPLAEAASVSSAPSEQALSQVMNPSALSWVRAQNARTFDSLQSDPRYQGFYDSILKAEQSPARLPTPEFIGGRIWNFWQDARHPRGIWRETSLASYEQTQPSWTTRLDVDALAHDEHANWVFQGSECLHPADARCLVALSDAGEDAVTLREFDPAAGRFVTNGFALPRGKQSAAWIDRDTLLVARDWSGAGADLTQSGYPFVVKAWHRGTKLGDAVEVMRGNAQDVEVDPTALVDEHGQQLVLINRGVTFFESRYAAVIKTPEGFVTRPLNLPGKVTIAGFSSGRLVLLLAQDWTLGTKRIPSGSVVAIDPADPARDPELIKQPTANQAIMDARVTRGGVLVTGYDRVQPQAALYHRGTDGAWQAHAIAVPGNESVKIAAASPSSVTAFLDIEGYIQPPQLWAADTATDATKLLHTTPDLFDAGNLTVEQLWTRSTDGTRIPYFLVHRRDVVPDGRNPVLLTAYGGFQASYLPTYYPDVGATWLAHGGVYAVANIRGGGEFGPAWHEAGRKSGRQRAYDDFASVGRDLVARHITSSGHLGIRGRSNGGLLMGVEFTQHPDLWKAVVIGVPLLDMLHYDKMAAGASWVDEYGSPANPAERPFLESISPLQHLRAGVDYPTPFIFTSTKDDRVGPVHARLFAARLQELGRPFYYYEDTEGGHAGTVNAPEIAHERALEAVYLTRALADPPLH